MQLGTTIFIAVGVFAASGLAQNPPGLAAANAMDAEILKLNDQPEGTRDRAIKDMAARIHRQPKEYAIALAYNLAVIGIEASPPDTLQLVADTLADAIQKAPAAYRDQSQYSALAELARYSHVKVAFDSPEYAAAMTKLEANDEKRAHVDFSLSGIDGKRWNLKSLRGKVVMVNFWATWCPPCRREIPDLTAIYGRFQDKGLVILALTDEDVDKVKLFMGLENVNYPVLLDVDHKVKDSFLIDGIPQTLVFDREGRLVSTAVDRPTMRGFLDMLAKAQL